MLTSLNFTSHCDLWSSQHLAWSPPPSLLGPSLSSDSETTDGSTGSQPSSNLDKLSFLPHWVGYRPSLPTELVPGMSTQMKWDSSLVSCHLYYSNKTLIDQ